MLILFDRCATDPLDSNPRFFLSFSLRSLNDCSFIVKDGGKKGISVFTQANRQRQIENVKNGSEDELVLVVTTEGRKEGRKEKLNGPWELRKPAAIYLSTFCIPWLFRLFILCQEFPSSINDIDGLHHHQTLLLVLQKSFSRIMRYCSLPLPVLLYNSR